MLRCYLLPTSIFRLQLSLVPYSAPCELCTVYRTPGSMSSVCIRGFQSESRVLRECLSIIPFIVSFRRLWSLLPARYLTLFPIISRHLPVRSALSVFLSLVLVLCILDLPPSWIYCLWPSFGLWPATGSFFPHLPLTRTITAF